MSAGFFALFDDIATLMDDAVVMSKVATKKTAGVLGDDLAVNAEKASGFASSRELPVIWAITKGSFINKLIILPFAFILSAFAPWLIVPILILGGLYLALEGAMKIYEYFFEQGAKETGAEVKELSPEEILAQEAGKIKSAILTDFILSIEIVIIALGTVADQSLGIQVIAVSTVAFLATIGVYGIVAFIVRLDDMGFALIAAGSRSGRGWQVGLGKLLVRSLPHVIRSLSVIGTVAMLLVAGGIFVHNIHAVHDALHFLPSILAELGAGLIVGVVVLAAEKAVLRLKKRFFA